jgi:RimJ/RimL family protein N-acetyltransferase
MKKVPADKDLQPLIRAVATGSDPDLERQLIEKSREPSILKYTPKDSSRRFRDQKSLEAWRAGGREVYWLLGQDDDLAGIIWYGKKDFPLDIDLPDRPTETFAIRIYDGYNGHGLAVPSMRQTLRMHALAAASRGEAPAGIWLETDVDNPAALHVYDKFGYREVARDDKRVTMVLPPSEITAIAKDGTPEGNQL